MKINNIMKRKNYAAKKAEAIEDMKFNNLKKRVADLDKKGVDLNKVKAYKDGDELEKKEIDDRYLYHVNAKYLLVETPETVSEPTNKQVEKILDLYPGMSVTICGLGSEPITPKILEDREGLKRTSSTTIEGIQGHIHRECLVLIPINKLQ